MRLFADVASQVEDPFFRHAIALAERGRGATAPNPVVGCVIAHDGVIVGEGFHACAGEPHAEVVALADAGEQAAGATAYVTLEPCGHHGRTPPCTDALIASGVSRVVIGMADPNPLAAGGASILRDAGVDVAFAEDPLPYRLLNEGWLKRTATGRPLVVAKVASSLDGHGALIPGRRAAITGEAGARVTQTLRRRSDAVVVGAATVIADDPALTVRNADGHLEKRQPMRVVCVRSRVPGAQSRVFTDGAASTLLVTDGSIGSIATGLPQGVDIRQTSGTGLGRVVELLGEAGCSEVLFEPGPTLLTSLWREQLIDRLVVVTAGGMAGATAPALYDGAPDASADQLVHAMEPLEAGIVGDVSVTVWQPAEPPVHTLS